jgi:hypothetical protein
MRTSRSSISTWLLVASLVLSASVASAGRKRVVVLDFDGPKAEKFHADVVKLIKKSHTVVATDKWNGAAEELGAGGVTEKNIKKVAKKLKVDGVVEGKIEKRRDEYIIRIKLHAGTSGEIVGNPVDTKAGGPKLDGKATRDLKDELVGAIDELETNHGGGASDDDADADVKPTKKKKAAAADDDAADSGGDEPKHGAFSKHADKGSDKVDDDASVKPSKKKKGAAADDDADADAKPAKTSKKKADPEVTAALATKHEDDDDSSAKPAKKKAESDSDSADSDPPPKKAKKRVSSSDDDAGTAEASSGDEGAASAGALSVTERAIDATLGLSFTARRMGFTYSPQLAGSQIPPGYRQSVPVAGAFIDAQVYPLAISHKGSGPLKGLGIEVLYDRVLRINSQKADNMGVLHSLATVSERYGIGPVYRYPIGKMAIGGRLLYEGQSFLIQQTLPDGEKTDIPDVSYSIFSIGAFARYPLMPKINLDADVAFLAVVSTGGSNSSIGSAMEYGKASVSGEELALGADYQLTKNIFLRAQFRLETIGLTFAGGPATLANNRDTDPNTQDVTAARDTYFGGMVTAGYAY